MSLDTGKLDAVTLEIIRGLLKATAEEMGINLVRSAYSHSIKERRDIATAVFDVKGRLVSQAEHIPIMLTGLYPIATFAATADLHAGDVIIANDPWDGGGSHLPDIALLTPVYHNGIKLGFVACIAHHSDVGGPVTGSTSIDATEVFGEGLRIPPTLLVQSGEIRRDVLKLITTNFRFPIEAERDFAAQIGALNLGHKRITNIAGKYGTETYLNALQALIARSEGRMRAAIAALPNGQVHVEDVLDSHTDSHPARIALTLTVSDHRIQFDFTGTSPQIPKAINMVMNATQASTYFVIASLFENEEDATHGTFSSLEITAPPGSIVNASDPAPIGGRAQTCPRIVDLLLEAFSSFLPTAVVANSNVGPALKISGIHPKTGQRFLISEVLGGGGGARATKNGLNGSQMYVTNTTNMPIEFLENEYPVVIESLELIDGSGGIGRQSGGMGIKKVFRVETSEESPADCGYVAERHIVAPKGLFGGGAGSPGSLTLTRRDGTRQAISHLSGHFMVRRGEAIEFCTSGGGGYGNPQSILSEDNE